MAKELDAAAVNAEGASAEGAPKVRAKRGEGPKIERNVYLQFKAKLTDADGNDISNQLPEGAILDFDVVSSTGDKRKALDLFMAAQKDKTILLKTLTL